MGLRDLFRSRSRSRPRNQQPVETEEAPPVPSLPSQQQAPEPQEEPSSSLPPLALLRPDSSYYKEPPPAVTPGSVGKAYSLTNDRGEEIGGASFSYDRVKEGTAPHQGTLPLHGNTAARLPSESRRRSTSRKSHGRSASLASSARQRPISENQSSSLNRRNIPPGTAVTSDEPITRTYSFNSHSSAPPETVTHHQRTSSRNIYSNTSSSPAPPAHPATAAATAAATDATTNTATAGPTTAIAAAAAAAATGAAVGSTYANNPQPAQTAVREVQSSKEPSQLNGTPTVPVIPGQYKANGPSTSPVNAISTTSIPYWKYSNRHERVDSMSSRASTASKTPIADEFASSSWYGRPGTPTAPAWSDVHGARSSPRPVSKGDHSSPLLRHQPDVGDFSSRVDRNSLQSSPSTATASSTFEDRGGPPSRGRALRRSYDRPLPIPKELRNAPWNRPENSQYTLLPDDKDKDDVNLTAPVAASNSNNVTNSVTPASKSVPIQSSGNYSDVQQGPQKVYSKQPATSGAAQAPSLDGIVDLRNTEDTTVYTRMAPAVTQETVKPSVHHVREEEITRDIHTHNVYHRVLPIIDVQVLPPKHYVPAADGSGFYEVPAESIPGRTIDDNTAKNWVIAETVSRLPQTEPLSAEQLAQPRTFTARTFGPTEGDSKEWIGDDGVRRTEKTWIHPPAIAQAPIESGITQPLKMPPREPQSHSPPSLQASDAQSSSRNSMSVPVPNRSSSKRMSYSPARQPNSTVSHLRSKSQPQPNAVAGPSILSSGSQASSSTRNAAIAAREAATVRFENLGSTAEQ